MGLGGGTWESFNKVIMGFYSRLVTMGVTIPEATNGVVAGGIISDWMPDNKAFTITKDQFETDPVAVTGFDYTAPENELLREIFTHAIEFRAYKLNSGGKAASCEGVGTAVNTGKVGNSITVSVLPNILDDTKYDVQTYVNGVEKDKQTVPEGKLNTASVRAGAEVAGDSLEEKEDLQAVTVTWSETENSVTAKIDKLPAGYELVGRIFINSAMAAVIPGRLDMETTSNRITWTFGGSCGAGQYTLEVRVKKTADGKYTTLKKKTENITINEGAIVGADGTQLQDNDFVSFDKTVIEPNAGYAFKGGSTKTSVTTADHQKLLNALEGKSFNKLFYDGTDETIKALYNAFTQRQRDNKGNYFQVVLENYADANYEGTISIYNQVLNPTNVKTLTPWIAAASSAIGMAEELTNYQYDGQLSVDANISQSRMEQLISTGHMFMHETGVDEVSVYDDVNTFRSFTDQKGEEVSMNKTIRVVDYIYNQLGASINRTVIGKVNNTLTGRSIVWGKIYDVLQPLVNQGAIDAFDEQNDIQILSVPGQPKSLEIRIYITINHGLQKIYMTTYVVPATV